MKGLCAVHFACDTGILEHPLMVVILVFTIQPSPRADVAVLRRNVFQKAHGSVMG